MNKMFQTCSERCFDPKLTEKAFKALVEELFPKYILTNGIPYFLTVGYLLGGGCRITYVSYNRSNDFDPALRKFVDAMDDDYRICIYNFLYLLSETIYEEVDKQICELLIGPGGRYDVLRKRTP